MTDVTQPVCDPPKRTWQPSQVFPVTTALVAAACVPIWIHILTSDAIRNWNSFHSPLAAIGITALLIGIFLFCELVPLRVEVRTETMMVALFEFPLVIGFLVLPWYLVLGAQLFAGISVYIVRRDDWPHSLLNVALVLADTGVALSAMIALAWALGIDELGIAADVTPLVVAAGVLAGTMTSPLIVGLAYRRLGPVEPVWKVLARSAGGACFVIVFALVEYTLWRVRDSGPYLAIALMLAVVMIYLAFRSMMSRHSTLNQLYTFIRSVGVAQADNTKWPEMMEMVRSHNNATIAVLYLENFGEYVVDSPMAKLLALAVDSTGQVRIAPVGTDDHLLQLAGNLGVVRASADKDTDPFVLAALENRGAKAVMVVALSASGRVRGYVEVRDRLSRWGQFTEEDAEFLSTLSVHMGTALENVQLLGHLRNEAYRDSVTGLRSRAGLSVDAEALMATSQLGALALVQLDTLSQVNNALGHRHGEELLVQAGQRITQASPQKRAVARLESDLFAILLEPMSEPDLALEVTSILKAISPSYSLAGVDVEVEPHAGIAVVGTDGTDRATDHVDAAGLLQRAEMALLASRNRHERFEIFRPTMGEVYRRRFQLVTQFRAAVDQGHIVVHYQPKVTLRNQQLRGVEALVRWVHPEFGVVTPGEFVKAIEATGSIDILLFHVLEIVLHQIRRWLDRGLQISVAVNLSVRNLTGKNFPERVAAALDRHQVPANLLTFELTESNVMTDPETALPILDELHSMGIALSVDDFGTGYSSLAYLRRLPIDEIKIDRSFVLGMSTALGDLAIVQSIIDLGHSLGLQVIAEGVEEEASREALRSMRCDGIQGFLLSRPQPVDRFEAWMAARTVRTTQNGTTQPVLRVVG